MCGACGIIGGDLDWIDRVDNADGIGHRPNLTRRAERQRRLQLVNLMLQASRSRADDTGQLIVVRAPTGRTEVIDSLAHVWTAVERIGLAAIDPLDERVLAAFREHSGT